MFVPRYDEQQARAAIAASTSWTEALRRLGLRAAGGNFRLLKRWAAEWGIDSSHFRPFAHAAEHLWREPIPLEDILVEHSSYGRASLKKRLYDEGLKARRCELCGLGEVWRGQPLTLILDHINGVHDDNRLENLRIVCPNCAATFATHCSRNLPLTVCAGCGKEFRRRRTRQQCCCLRCWHDSPACRAIRRSDARRKAERPTYEQLVADLREMSFVKVGAKYGVSDNAVRKWLRGYETPPKGGS